MVNCCRALCQGHRRFSVEPFTPPLSSNCHQKSRRFCRLPRGEIMTAQFFATFSNVYEFNNRRPCAQRWCLVRRGNEAEIALKPFHTHNFTLVFTTCTCLSILYPRLWAASIPINYTNIMVGNPTLQPRCEWIKGQTWRVLATTLLAPRALQKSRVWQ